MSKIQYCPYCGKKLVSISDRAAFTNLMCIDSKCRCMITNTVIEKLDIDEYVKMQDIIEDCINNNLDKTVRYWVLTKKESNSPILFKNTTNPVETHKQTLCIIQADTHDEALEIMQTKFKVMKITPDMVVEISITIS